MPSFRFVYLAGTLQCPNSFLNAISIKKKQLGKMLMTTNSSSPLMTKTKISYLSILRNASANLPGVTKRILDFQDDLFSLLSTVLIVALRPRTSFHSFLPPRPISFASSCIVLVGYLSTKKCRKKICVRERGHSRKTSNVECGVLDRRTNPSSQLRICFISLRDETIAMGCFILLEFLKHQVPLIGIAGR